VRTVIRTREAWLSALALFLAIRTLETLQGPPQDDLEDMRTLLLENFPTYAATLEAMPQQA